VHELFTKITNNVYGYHIALMPYRQTHRNLVGHIIYTLHWCVSEYNLSGQEDEQFIRIGLISFISLSHLPCHLLSYSFK